LKKLVISDGQAKDIVPITSKKFKALN